MYSALKIAALGIMAVVCLGAKEPACTSFAANPASADMLTVFSFDDYSIPYRRNLFLSMHLPIEYEGNPVVRHGMQGSPDECGAQFWGSMCREAGKFRMWYLASDRRAEDNLAHNLGYLDWHVCYAESDDGLKWAKPDLQLVDFHGNRNNNIVRLAPHPPGVGNVMVLYEPDDPIPAKRFKMMLLVWAHADSGAPKPVINNILPFYSSDGLTWRQAIPARIDQEGKIDEEAAQLGNENFEMGGLNRFQGTYYVTGQQLSPYAWLPDGSECGRVMSIFRSYDFLHWSDTKTQGFVRWGYHSTPPNGGEEVHMPAATWNRGNVLLGLYGQFHGSPHAKDHPIDLGLLLSNDGVHFREPSPDYVFLARAQDRSWEAGGLGQGQGFVNVGDKTFVYFCGIDGDITSPYGGAGIGVATLRRDGFGSISSKRSDEPASFVTCALEARAKVQVCLNADGLSPEARLKVELLDETEHQVPEYSDTNAAVVVQSGIHVAARWKTGYTIVPPAGRFRLRISFDGARREQTRFYALYLSGGG